MKNIRFYSKEYIQVYRSTAAAIEFEVWLYENGGIVIQHNHQRYIQFEDDQSALMFTLTNIL